MFFALLGLINLLLHVNGALSIFKHKELSILTKIICILLYINILHHTLEILLTDGRCRGITSNVHTN